MQNLFVLPNLSYMSNYSKQVVTFAQLLSNFRIRNLESLGNFYTHNFPVYIGTHKIAVLIKIEIKYLQQGNFLSIKLWIFQDVVSKNYLFWHNHQPVSSDSL